MLGQFRATEGAAAMPPGAEGELGTKLGEAVVKLLAPATNSAVINVNAKNATHR